MDWRPRWLTKKINSFILKRYRLYCFFKFQLSDNPPTWGGGCQIITRNCRWKEGESISEWAIMVEPTGDTAETVDFSLDWKLISTWRNGYRKREYFEEKNTSEEGGTPGWTSWIMHSGTERVSGLTIFKFQMEVTNNESDAKTTNGKVVVGKQK